MSERERFVVYARQWTGKPVSRAHVLDRETGKIVASCPHLHRQRRHRDFGPDGLRRITSGVAFAERCAVKLLANFMRSHA